jgi:hypothetical protein
VLIVISPVKAVAVVKPSLGLELLSFKLSKALIPITLLLFKVNSSSRS